MFYMMLAPPDQEYNSSYKTVSKRKYLLYNPAGCHYPNHMQWKKTYLLILEEQEAGFTYIDIILQDVARRSRLVWLSMCCHESSHTYKER